MDQERFDALTRSLGTGRTRRGVLKALTGTAVGGVMTAVGMGGTSPRGTRLASATGTHWVGMTTSPSPRAPSPPTASTVMLINPDLANDLSNCGLCGNVCPEPEDATATCSAGSCGFTCDDGFTVNEAGDGCVADNCTGGCMAGDCPARVTLGPPAQATFTIQDTETGLGYILVTQSQNADTVVPPFTLGTTFPQSVTSTKIDQSQPASITIQHTSFGGTTRTCELTF